MLILDGWDEETGFERLITVTPEELVGSVEQEERYGPDNAGACAEYDLEVSRYALQRDGSVLVDGLLFDAACETRECHGDAYTAFIEKVNATY